MFRKLRGFIPGGSGSSDTPVAAIFGKHPAWNDHVEDPGLSASPALVEFRRIFYNECLQAAVNSKWWQEVGEADRQAFGHALLWQPGGKEETSVCCLLEPSRDGSAAQRRDFPLILALAIRSRDADHLRIAFGELIAAMRDAESAGTQQEALAAVRACPARVQEALGPSSSRPTIEQCKARLTGGRLESGSLEKALGEVSIRMGVSEPSGSGEIPLYADDLPAVQVRLPASQSQPIDDLLAWTSYWRAACHPRQRFLGLRPRAIPAMDMIFGTPSPTAVRALRAGPSVIGIVTEDRT